MSSDYVVLTFPDLQLTPAGVATGVALLESRRAFLAAVARGIEAFRPTNDLAIRALLGLAAAAPRRADRGGASVLAGIGSVVVRQWMPIEELQHILQGTGVVAWGTEPFELADVAGTLGQEARDWHLTSTNVRGAGTDGAGVVVGMLDASMPTSNRDVLGIPAENYKEFFCPGNGELSYHSAATATLLCDGELGAAPAVEVVLAAVARSVAPGVVRGDPGDVVRGVEWLLQWDRGGRQVSVISASIAMSKKDMDGFLLALELAAKWRELPIIVAGSGNEGTIDEPSIAVPAGLAGVIAVGAATAARAVAERSGWAREPIAKPELVAPGVAVYTVDPTGGIGPRDGTSFAAPIVAGLVARLLASGVPSAEVVRRVTTEYVRDIDGEVRDGAGMLLVPEGGVHSPPVSG